MIDIVIDTCTLKHANDPNSKYFEHSVTFINKMFQNNVICTMDEGFALDESLNQSYIGLEYLNHLQPGSLGFNLIVHLATTNRIEFVTKKIPNGRKKYIEQLIRNKKDRIFLSVTHNSNDKTLASHDFTDYQKKKRKKIFKDIAIKIVTAEEIGANL